MKTWKNLLEIYGGHQVYISSLEKGTRTAYFYFAILKTAYLFYMPFIPPYFIFISAQIASCSPSSSWI